MILAHGATDCNGRATQRLYAEKHPVGRTPAHTMFARLHQQLCGTGSFQKAARTELNEEIVLDMVETTPSLSTRGDHLIGPYILPGHLTGPRYLIFLEQVLPKLLDRAHVTAVTRTSMWFQQDGAPAHFSISVRNHLDAVCGERWIGRGGQCVDFSDRQTFPVWIIFFWGQMKSLVYETPVNSAEELVARISAAAGKYRNTQKCYRMFDAP
ncbi:uncharacterized protein TNCV_3646381 [Trichonephila clavipes]|nr:uncharacterized protein TNCV_3646381 [Trichonephila clavipes]